MNSDRIFEIDVVRGTAMFAVCLSHFNFIYLYANIGHTYFFVIWIDIFCRFASPAFVIISGIMLGFFYQNQEKRWGETKTKLLDRGLFLLSIGHLLMMTGNIAKSLDFFDLLRWWYITDTIGICIIIGCILIPRIRVCGFMSLGVAMLMLSSTAVLLWHPGSTFLIAMKETLFGSLNPHFYNYSFPVLMWIGLYFLGIFSGRKLGFYAKQSNKCEVLKGLRSSCLVLFGLAFAGKGIQTLFIEKASPAYWLGSVSVRYPPSPTFLLFFGGVTLLALWTVFKIARAGKVKILLSPIAVMGRTSFFIFVIQYYVYFTLIYLLKLPYTHLWPLYFLGSIVVIWLLSKIWDEKKLNRLITLRGFIPINVKRLGRVTLNSMLKILK